MNLCMNLSKLWVNKGKRRYYKVMVYRDLLGDLILLRNWGSLDNERGGMKKEVVSHQEAEAMLVAIEKKRISHRYQLVSTVSE